MATKEVSIGKMSNINIQAGFSTSENDPITPSRRSIPQVHFH